MGVNHTLVTIEESLEVFAPHITRPKPPTQ